MQNPGWALLVVSCRPVAVMLDHDLNMTWRTVGTVHVQQRVTRCTATRGFECQTCGEMVAFNCQRDLSCRQGTQAAHTYPALCSAGISILLVRLPTRKDLLLA